MTRVASQPTARCTIWPHVVVLILAAGLAAASLLAGPLASHVPWMRTHRGRLGAGGGRRFRGPRFVPVNATGGPIQRQLLEAARAAADWQGALIFTVRGLPLNHESQSLLVTLFLGVTPFL